MGFHDKMLDLEQPPKKIIFASGGMDKDAPTADGDGNIRCGLNEVLKQKDKPDPRTKTQ